MSSRLRNRRSLARLIPATLILALLIYGLCTVLFSARDLGGVWDERLYKEAGMIYMQQHHFAANHDHPPLSKWLAALYPYYSGNQSTEAFRYAHAVIYAGGGGWIAFQLLGWGYTYAAVIFAALFFLCPNLKAMASLNVLDTDLAIWMGLTALYTWRGFSGLRTFGVSLLQGFAMMTKIPALVYLPFYALRVKQILSRRTFALAIAGLFLATMIAYHFRFIEIGSFAGSLGVQWKHSRIGQGVYLLGKHSDRGFWYTYLVLFFLKDPIPTLVALLGAAGVLVIRLTSSGDEPQLQEDRRIFRDVLVYWVAPALIIGGLLSVGSVQLGFRYLLPSLVFFYLAAAVVLERWIRSLRGGEKASAIVLVFGLGIWLLSIDATTIDNGSYLAYFNSFTYRPTRNFSDSNIDWLQGIPKHLLKRLPSFIPLEDLTATGTLSKSGNDSVTIGLGATDLCCGWGGWFPERELGPSLAGVGQTIWSGAGYELLRVSHEELCHVLRENDHIPPHDVLVLEGPSTGKELDSAPSWGNEDDPEAIRHPFRVDGRASFHDWRGWIPVDVIDNVRFVDATGKRLDDQLFVRASCD